MIVYKTKGQLEDWEVGKVAMNFLLQGGLVDPPTQVAEWKVTEVCWRTGSFSGNTSCRDPCITFKPGSRWQKSQADGNPWMDCIWGWGPSDMDTGFREDIRWVWRRPSPPPHNTAPSGAEWWEMGRQRCQKYLVLIIGALPEFHGPKPTGLIVGQRIPGSHNNLKQRWSWRP